MNSQAAGSYRKLRRKNVEEGTNRARDAAVARTSQVNQANPSSTLVENVEGRSESGSQASDSRPSTPTENES